MQDGGKASKLSFRPIDLERDWDALVRFHRDLFEISFGADRTFSEDIYRGILHDRLAKFPGGQMLALAGGAIVGQVEFWTRPYEGRDVGYVSLFYLTPDWRGRGLGVELVESAERYFRTCGMTEYQLRVSERNERALRFYLRQGFTKLASEERDGVVTWLMGKSLLQPA